MKNGFGVCILGIHICSIFDQELHHLQISSHCCFVERGFIVCPKRIDISTVLKAHLGCLKVVCSSSKVQNSVVMCISVLYKSLYALATLGG